MSGAPFTCPFCGLKTVVPGDHVQETLASPPTHCAQGPSTFRLLVTVCPNQDCTAMTAVLDMYEYDEDARGMLRIAAQPKKTWKLVPATSGKQFPEYVPERIVKEYNDACATLEINPSVSATLARRCLQAIVRDFFAVKKNTLADEFEAIKEKVDPEVSAALDAIRKTGGVGKNMEKGVNLVFDCDPGEPELLIGLIEILVDETYVARQARKNRLEAVRGRVSLKPTP